MLTGFDTQPGERSIERLRVHYDVERELAARLRHASAADRSILYGEVYDELFRRVPDHPQLTRPADPDAVRRQVRRHEQLVGRFLSDDGVFLEVGAGDCALSLAIARWARCVYAIDVSAEIARVESPPSNFSLLLTDGTAIPVPRGSVDLAYSNQLMEHLHPDDAVAQLENVAAAVRPGGRYICLTPHRLLGPGDISGYFTEGEAEGFHLREYSTLELAVLLRNAGFRAVRVLGYLRGRDFLLPLWPLVVLEVLFERLPTRLRARLKRSRLVRKLLQPGGGVVAVR